VWTFLQSFLTQFPKYESRDFGIFTESYGGHYGPEFAHYLETQNTAIAAGTVKGEKINLVAIGINNGIYDSTIQEKANIEFAYNNTYRPLITASQVTSLTNSYNNKCLPDLKACTGTSGTNSACIAASNACNNDIGAFDRHSLYLMRTAMLILRQTTSSTTVPISTPTTFAEPAMTLTRPRHMSPT
jgi:carboxypeptidase D